MENSQNQLAKVGVFVGLGLIALLGSILLLGEDQAFFKKTYNLNIQFKEVQGLATGSVVSLSGIQIGNVRDIQLTDENGIIVKVALDQKYQSRITQDSQINIKTQGALGDRYIYIEPGASGGSFFKDNDLVIAETGPGLLDVLSERGSEVGHIFEILKETHLLLQALNGDGRTNQILNNLSTSSVELKEVLKESKLLIQDLRGKNNEDGIPQMTQKLNRIVSKIESSEGTLGLLINDRSLFDKVTSFLGESPRDQYLKPLIRETLKARDEK